jgi:hypothetical protein
MPRACHGLNTSDTATMPQVCRDGGNFRSSKMLPALFIIGSLKTGTTSLWSQLVDQSHGHVVPGALTDKGDVSRKEKDFFGDPSMFRRGYKWYERIWPTCPKPSDHVVAIDATPAYHVWHDAPKNMANFYGPKLKVHLRFVWMLRDPIAKFWSYFWELKAYGGEWTRVEFGAWVKPKLERSRKCLSLDPQSALWPPSLPPPFRDCAPHLDHGLYEPQLRRWLSFFQPSQLLLVSFAGYTQHPAAVVRDILAHAQLPGSIVTTTAGRVRRATKLRNSRASGHGHMPAEWQEQLRQLYSVRALVVLPHCLACEWHPPTPRCYPSTPTPFSPHCEHHACAAHNFPRIWLMRTALCTADG